MIGYTKKEINNNFKIKVYGVVEGRKVDMLVGVSGCIRLIGEELMAKQLDRAFKSRADKCVCKLRRGLKVTYYAN